MKAVSHTPVLVETGDASPGGAQPAGMGLPGEVGLREVGVRRWLAGVRL